MEKHVEIIGKKIEKRIIKQGIDEKQKVDLIDDFEYDEHQTEIE